MRCLVTGGSGFIGSHLVQKLLDAGHDVVVLDLRPPLADVEWMDCDIRDDLGDALQGFDAVYHLAAIANARKAGEYPALTYTVNVLGTLNVLQAARRGDVGRVLLASSSWLAGAQTGDVIEETAPFRLTDINTVYGAAKVGQETLCYSFFSEFGGPDYTIMRYGIPYGEWMWKGLVVRAFMDMAQRFGVVNIMGDGKQYREFLYVGDLCDAQVAALAPVARNKVYNFTGERPITVEELAQQVIRHFPAQIDFVPQARVEPKLKRIKNDSARSDLNWKPVTSLDDGITRCVNWWLSLSDAEKQIDYWLPDMRAN
jgi:UDP-glucose 4-epimerase